MIKINEVKSIVHNAYRVHADMVYDTTYFTFKHCPLVKENKD